MCAVCFSSHQLCRVLIYVLITSNITLSAQMMTRVGAWVVDCPTQLTLYDLDLSVE